MVHFKLSNGSGCLRAVPLQKKRRHAGQIGSQVASVAAGGSRACCSRFEENDVELCVACGGGFEQMVCCRHTRVATSNDEDVARRREMLDTLMVVEGIGLAPPV
jgi:hypothetical protein